MLTLSQFNLYLLVIRTTYFVNVLFKTLLSTHLEQKIKRQNHAIIPLFLRNFVKSEFIYFSAMKYSRNLTLAEFSVTDIFSAIARFSARLHVQFSPKKKSFNILPKSSLFQYSSVYLAMRY